MLTSIPVAPAIAPSVASARLMRLARAGWVGLALFLLVVFAVGTVLRHGDMLQPCEATLEVCMLAGRLRPVNLQGLDSPEAALQFHAVFYTLEQTAARLLLWAFALFLFMRQRNDWMALLTAFWLLTYAPPFAEYAAAQRWTWLAAPIQGTRIISQVCFPLFLFLFPTGRFAPSWMRWPALAFIVYNLAGYLVPEWLAGPVLAPWTAFVPVLQYGVALYSQVYRYRRMSTPLERLQTKWVVFGMALAALFLLGTRIWIILDWYPDQRISPSFYLQIMGFVLATSAIPVTLGIAILRFRLFAIDVLINRALVYGLLSACVAGAYVAIVGGLGALFQLQGNLLLSLLATVGIAIVFQPLRERLQRAVNRLMVGERDEPYRVLTRLGQRLELALEPASALPLTVETVARALKLPYVAITLKQDGGYQPAAAYGELRGELTRFPLVYAGETIGELLAARRSPNEPLTAPDQQLLNDLARQIGVSAHAALLAAELERARLRIVVTQEETRRRLGSDLHDGVGHQLAALLRRVELATLVLEQNPVAARELLGKITQQLNSAISQVRALAHELHPPELELLGLVGALRERAETHASPPVRLDAPDRLPPLPTAIETAAYYIALEALTNVSKHARAHTCLVRLNLSLGQSALQPTILEMEISDDGRGLTADTANGLGLLSMRARAAQVGGTCHIESAPNEGTRVSVRLPCPAILE